jgi:putative ABC transport system permease protein
MTWWRRVWRRRQLEEQLDKELRFHMEQHAADLVARGCTTEQAWRQARIAFGGPEQVKEDCRDARGTRWLEDCIQDLRYALRTLRQSPAFAITAALTLALGIGANTAIFSVVNAALLRPLPYPEPNRLVWITELVRNNTTDQITFTADFLEWRERNHVFSQLAAFNPWARSLTRAEGSESLKAAKAFSELLPALGVQPLLGRNFTREEDQRGSDHVAILSYGLWQRSFGADAGVLGKAITLDGEPFTVIGVLPQGFQFPSNQNVDVLTPLGKDEATELKRGEAVTVVQNVVGRLKPGVSIEQAKAELEVIQAGFRPPSIMPMAQITIRALPLHRHLIGNVREAVLVLLGAVAFLLLIACANVANLLLARATVREREIAIRTALGSSRGRLVRQLLTESLTLAAIGCAIGLIAARWARGLLLAVNPARLPTLSRLDFDWRVLAFAACCAASTAIAFGLAPALVSTRISLNESLKSAAGSLAGGRRQRRWLHGLAAAELALAVVLLTGAGLLIESFWRLRYTGLGFEPEHLLTATIGLPPPAYPARQVAFIEQIRERLRALPGVDAVAIADSLPPGASVPTNGFGIEGRPLQPLGKRQVADWQSVNADYFRIMGIPLVQGRAILESDTEAAPPIAVVSRALANRYFPGENVIGKRIRTGSRADPYRTIVGVVGDVKTAGLTKEPQPIIYHAYRQFRLPALRGYFVIRTAIAPALIAAALRKEPVASIQTMDDRLTNSVTQPRFAAAMLAAFAALALLLSSVGIYSVIVCVVGWQTREIGIRRALGAQPADVLRMVLGQGLRITLLGLGCGIAGALALTQTLRGFLFGVSATDPVVLTGASIVLSAVALAACCAPARRALRVDPTVALRYE